MLFKPCHGDSLEELTILFRMYDLHTNALANSKQETVTKISGNRGT